jgi:hypothetical protein
MDLLQLEARLKVLEEKNQKLEAIEEIKRLQSIYGYYVERGQLDEVADLFSDSPDVSLNMSNDVMVGKEKVKSIFSSQKPFGVLQGPKPDDYLHITMPVSGVIDVDPDGKTARGRWYVLMYLCNATPGGGAVFGVGLYENDYIKENGTWKILHLCFDDIFLTPYEDGWAKTSRLIEKMKKMSITVEPMREAPNQPVLKSKKSPFGGPIPFHYKHPVTGK